MHTYSLKILCEQTFLDGRCFPIADPPHSRRLKPAGLQKRLALPDLGTEDKLIELQQNHGHKAALYVQYRKRMTACSTVLGIFIRRFNHNRLTCLSCTTESHLRIYTTRAFRYEVPESGESFS